MPLKWFSKGTPSHNLVPTSDEQQDPMQQTELGLRKEKGQNINKFNNISNNKK